MAEIEKTVLVVDDDPDIVAAIRMVLKANGYQVRSATNSDEAMQALQNEIPDLMIVDVMMRTLDEGFQLSYMVRGDERLAQIPILMLTSVSKETGFSFDPNTDGQWLPVDEFVEKPIDPIDLLTRVGRLTNQSN